ncbi:acyl-CoA dehydrogenase family protein [Actinomadura roseirufa]|uniref:acyl-CoA dehydrogenase family protein n=1 Tax=Actinomadura roseirufa TaxID=2094049 RepID=UPI001040ED7C|nr:acyl-CoA dehydrogenase family protein [Actinomadura roseirufa]
MSAVAGRPFSLARPGFDASHDLFRQTVRAFVERDIVPRHEEWCRAGMVDKELFARAGAAGLLGIDVPESHGGGGVPDFRYNAIITEEGARAHVASSVAGLHLHIDVCVPYFLDAATDAQRDRWLPGICAGTLVTALAMTEPSCGSDVAAMTTTATRDGDHYVINGAKTFISNSQNFDLLLLACKTDPTQRHRGISIIVVEADRPGLERGRRLAKAGQHSADTGELFFTDVRVPVANRLGAEGGGFAQLMTKLPRERLSIAVGAVAQAEAALDLTLGYVGERHAFGRPIGSFQNSRFRLAEMRTEIDIARVFVDRQIEALNAGELTPEAAAEAKWWTTEMCHRVVDGCVQLHGGYGYMDEYPVSRAWRDTRVMRILGGTTEIMKEVIGRGMGL